MNFGVPHEGYRILWGLRVFPAPSGPLLCRPSVYQAQSTSAPDLPHSQVLGKPKSYRLLIYPIMYMYMCIYTHVCVYIYICTYMCVYIYYIPIMLGYCIPRNLPIESVILDSREAVIRSTRDSAGKRCARIVWRETIKTCEDHPNHQWIGLRENLQENPILNGKIYGFL